MKIVTFGEIMLRLSPPGFQRFTQARSFDEVYGGGEANVAISLASFGEDVEYVTCSRRGGGWYGEQIDHSRCYKR